MALTQEQIEARTAKSIETKQATQAQREKKIIVNGYALYWFDEYNWCVEPVRGDVEGRKFYPSFIAGAQGLLSVAVDKAARSTSDLGRLTRLINDIKSSIEKEVRLWA